MTVLGDGKNQHVIDYGTPKLLQTSIRDCLGSNHGQGQKDTRKQCATLLDITKLAQNKVIGRAIPPDNFYYIFATINDTN